MGTEPRTATNTHEWKGRVLGAVSGPRKKFGFAGQMRDHRGSVRVGQAGQGAWVKTVSRLGAELVAVCSGVLIAVSAVLFLPRRSEAHHPTGAAAITGHTAGVLVFFGDEWKSDWRFLRRGGVLFNHGPSSKADAI